MLRGCGGCANLIHGIRASNPIRDARKGGSPVVALHKSVEVRGEGVAPRSSSEADIDNVIGGNAEVGVAVGLEC